MVFRAIVIGFVRIGSPAGHQNTEAILPVMATNLIHRFVEVILILPLNVNPFFFSDSTSNLEVGITCCAGDGWKWKIAAAHDHNGHNYA